MHHGSHGEEKKSLNIIGELSGRRPFLWRAGIGASLRGRQREGEVRKEHSDHRQHILQRETGAEVWATVN